MSNPPTHVATAVASRTSIHHGLLHAPVTARYPPTVEASIAIRDFNVLFSVLAAKTVRGNEDIKGSKVLFSIRTVR